jgi:alpha-glucosidase
LASPAAEVIKSLPSVWDETIVLPTSAIGELAVFARRSGGRWFLGVLNGPTPRTLRVGLSFLGKGTYEAVLVRDKGGESAAVEIEPRKATALDSLDIVLRAGGGFAARFSRQTEGEMAR